LLPLDFTETVRARFLLAFHIELLFFGFCIPDVAMVGGGDGQPAFSSCCVLIIQGSFIPEPAPPASLFSNLFCVLVDSAKLDLTCAVFVIRIAPLAIHMTKVRRSYAFPPSIGSVVKAQLKRVSLSFPRPFELDV